MHVRMSTGNTHVTLLCSYHLISAHPANMLHNITTSQNEYHPPATHGNVPVPYWLSLTPPRMGQCDTALCKLHSGTRAAATSHTISVLALHYHHRLCCQLTLHPPKFERRQPDPAMGWCPGRASSQRRASRPHRHPAAPRSRGALLCSSPAGAAMTYIKGDTHASVHRRHVSSRASADRLVNA